MKLDMLRWIYLVAFVAFAGYTVWCIRTENFWRACRGVFQFSWGRQVTADLYLGLSIFLFIVYLNERSFAVLLAWLIPTLVLGNVTSLFYLILNFDAIVGHFR